MNATITLTINKVTLDRVLGALQDMSEAISEDWLPECDNHVAWSVHELARALEEAANERDYYPKATALGLKLYEAEGRIARAEAENYRLRCTIEKLKHGMELLEERVEIAAEEVAQ